MQPTDLLSFLREHRLAAEASVSGSSSAQAAVVGFAISDAFEIAPGGKEFWKERGALL
jgi:hypothetical protein